MKIETKFDVGQKVYAGKFSEIEYCKIEEITINEDGVCYKCESDGVTFYYLECELFFKKEEALEYILNRFIKQKEKEINNYQKALLEQLKEIENEN